MYAIVIVIVIGTCPFGANPKITIEPIVGFPLKTTGKVRRYRTPDTTEAQ